MKKTLLISNDIYYKIDLFLYKNYDITHITIEKVYNFDTTIYENVICIIDPQMFDFIVKTGLHKDTPRYHNDIFTDDEDSNLNLLFKNFSYFYQNFPTHTKYILYDNDIESPNISISKFVPHWLEISPNNYSISSRIVQYVHKNSISELIYLTIIYSFYLLNFYKYPMLELPNVKSTKYDFITYLGHTAKPNKIQYRLNFLRQIFDNDLTKIKYKDLNIIDDELMGSKKEGHFWNLLNSLSAKIQLIFETSVPECEWNFYDYLTEKIMKCFISSHPYIVLLPAEPLEMLEKYGFKFPVKCDTIKQYKKEINYVKNNIDEWVAENQQVFYDNQINFYKMIESTELPHHIFLEKILNNDI